MIKNIKEIIFITVDIAVIILVFFAGILGSFGWQVNPVDYNLSRYEFFTVDSNLIAAASLLIALPFKFMRLARKKEMPFAIVLTAFTGTVSVMITFVTVVAFLTPQGVEGLYYGNNFVLHVLCPLLTLCSFIFTFTSVTRFKVKYAPVGLIPMVVYGIFYFIRVVILNGKDFYGFNQTGQWYLSALFMLIGSYFVSLIVWALRDILNGAHQTVTYNVFADGIEKDLKFVFLSDLHECDTKPIMEKIEEISPDAVLISGDYIHDDKEFEVGFAFLKECASKFPTFCSIGNHETKFGGDVRQITRDTGAVLLDDEDTVFKGVRIGGLTTGFLSPRQYHFKPTPEPNLQYLKEYSEKDGYKILLSHHPEYYPRFIRDTDVQLTLSGHAHGGQWTFFGRGWFAPGQGFMAKYVGGYYENRLIVSRGLGNAHSIFRLNNPFDLIIINLISGK